MVVRKEQEDGGNNDQNLFDLVLCIFQHVSRIQSKIKLISKKVIHSL